MLKINDIVKTDFYKKDSELLRKVIKIKPYVGASESGYEVTTKDEKGRVLACDMNWYTKAI